MEEGKLIKQDYEYYLEDDLGVTIATTDKILLKETDTVKKLSLKNCEYIENGYDLNDLADWYGVETEMKSGRKVVDEDFIAGFETALQILSNKKFTENQVRMAIEIAWRNDIENTKIDIIESITKSKWDVEIEMERSKFISDKSLRNDIKNGFNYTPKLDTDGCLILKPRQPLIDINGNVILKPR